MDYTEDEMRTYIDKAIQQDGRQPRFYVITGSHIYGINSADSDVDIRGFHMADGGEYAYLDTPKEEVSINMDGVTQGFEEYADLDLRSYELRKFGRLLYKANYNIIEQLLCADPIMNGVPLEIEGLRELIKDHLPLNVPNTYFGMAKSNYYKHLDRNKPNSYTPKPKKFLYVYRGLLAAQYVMENEDVIADVHDLVAEVDAGDETLVDDLVAVKRDADQDLVTGDLEEQAHTEIANLFNDVSPPNEPDKSGYKAAIDEWMRKVRK